MTPHPATSAGASARAQFERRDVSPSDAVRRARTGILARTVTGVAVGMAMMLVAPAWWLFGVALSMTVILGALVALVVRPSRLRSLWVGTEGEWQTAGVLAQLTAVGYRVLDDRRVAGSRAPVDHIVVGPTGVFVVETRARSRGVRVAGRRGALVNEVARQADAVAVALPGTQVIPLVCVHDADLPRHPVEVDGVRVVGPRGLWDRVQAGPVRLGRADIDRLAGQLDARLGRAA